MLRNIGETRANLPFELAVLMVDELCQKWDCSRINYELSELWGVFADLAQSRCRNSFEGRFGFLNAEN
jgi:hypothetical protein